MACAAVSQEQSAGVLQYVVPPYGLSVIDRTKGLAQVALQKGQQAAIYSVTLAGKKLVPVGVLRERGFLSHLEGGKIVDSQMELLYFDSRTLTVEYVAPSIVKITEEDHEGSTTTYVDTSICEQEHCHPYYDYMPRALTMEEAAQKLSNVKYSFCAFPHIAVYNCHGAAFFYEKPGSDKHWEGYWASPDDRQAGKITSSHYDERTRRITASYLQMNASGFLATSIRSEEAGVTSLDDNVHVSLSLKEDCYLNHEIAQRIVRPQPTVECPW